MVTPVGQSRGWVGQNWAGSRPSGIKAKCLSQVNFGDE